VFYAVASRDGHIGRGDLAHTNNKCRRSHSILINVLVALASPIALRGGGWNTLYETNPDCRMLQEQVPLLSPKAQCHPVSIDS